MNNRKRIGFAVAIGGVFLLTAVGVFAFNDKEARSLHGEAETKERGFETMAVTPDNVANCVEPKAPADLGIVPIQNAYAQIARIMALEKTIAIKSCACPYGLVNWDEVVDAAPGYERNDGAEIRFDNVKLRLRADALAATLKTSCGG